MAESLTDRLAEALRAQGIMRQTVKPQKLDEALTWRQNDDLAEKMAREALAAYDAARQQPEAVGYHPTGKDFSYLPKITDDVLWQLGAVAFSGLIETVDGKQQWTQLAVDFCAMLSNHRHPSRPEVGFNEAAEIEAMKDAMLARGRDPDAKSPWHHGFQQGWLERARRAPNPPAAPGEGM